MFVKWIDEKYSVGVNHLDNQHKELLSIANDLHQLQRSNSYHDESINILERLYAYTGYHFITEEGLFREYNYHLVDEHIAEHRKFKAVIKQELIKVKKDSNYPIDKLLNYLKKWILSHVQGDDQIYAKFFKDNKLNVNNHFYQPQTSNSELNKLWDAKQLNLDLHVIDNQHKELIFVLQQTFDLLKANDQRKRVFLPIIIKKLFYYARYHFLYEENEMSKFNYPDISKHKQLHANFIEDIQNFAKDYHSGKSQINEELCMYLKTWTIDHILDEDKKIKKYLLNHNMDVQ